MDEIPTVPGVSLKRLYQLFPTEEHLVKPVWSGGTCAGGSGWPRTWTGTPTPGSGRVENQPDWLCTRICLDMPRSRASRRERGMSSGQRVPDEAGTDGGASGPEEEAPLADSVGLALLVVLARLSPCGRVAFVLRDSFPVPFEESAPIG